MSRVQYFECTVSCHLAYCSLDVGRLNPDRGDNFQSCPDWPLGQSKLLYSGYQVFPGNKVFGIWHKRLTPFNAELEEGVELYVHCTSMPS